MNDFEQYISKLRESVREKPKNDKERGFQIAVILIHNRFKIENEFDKSKQTK